MSYPAFLAAIRDEPDSDVPRLICADWLEDQGESDRAELIRIQVELTRGVKERRRSLELLRRLRAIIVQHRANWLGPLALDEPEAIFARGFVEHATLRARTLLDHGETIFAAHPIHRLRVEELGDLGAEVAECEQLACLATLDLSENRLGADAAEAFGTSPYLSRCQSLNLSSTQMSDAHLARLVAGVGLRGVRRLALRDNPFTATAAASLACSVNVSQLTELILNSSRIGDRGAQTLAAATTLPHLEVLRVSYCALTETSARALLTSPNLPKLRLLEVYGTEMNNEARGRLRGAYRNRVVC